MAIPIRNDSIINEKMYKGIEEEILSGIVMHFHVSEVHNRRADYVREVGYIQCLALFQGGTISMGAENQLHWLYEYIMIEVVRAYNIPTLMELEIT